MSSKFISRGALAKTLKKYRGTKKIVFTNGCFDLLHLGHVRLLEKAKKLGDILVVAINADRSVKKLKGAARPLMPVKSRAGILSALGSVDYVTSFPEETPSETLELLKPDVLVKGSDYELSQIAGRGQVKKVVRIPLVKNLSTSRLIQKILHAYANKTNR